MNLCSQISPQPVYPTAEILTQIIPLAGEFKNAPIPRRSRQVKAAMRH